MVNWRISDELLALTKKSIDNENLVYLVKSMDKSYLREFKKEEGLNLDKEGFIEKKIFDGEFNLKLNNRLEVYIRSKELPEPESWYKLCNFDNSIENIGNIITEVGGNNLGNYEDKVFKCAFNTQITTKVILLNYDMSIYDEAFNNMIRSLNCTMYKKTKKRIPGHRYDSEDSTIIYLGDVYMRFAVPNSNKLTDKISLVVPSKTKSEFIKVQLIVFGLKDTEKSISDVLDNRYLSTREYPITQRDIKDSYDKVYILPYSESKSLVDSGEVLPRENILNKDILNLLRNTLLSGNKFLSILTYFMTSISENIIDLKDYINNLEEIIQNILDEVLVMTTELSSDNANEVLFVCKKLLLSKLISGFIELNPYINLDNTGLSSVIDFVFSEFGIDLDDIVKNAHASFDINKFLLSNFDNYIKYIDSYLDSINESGRLSYDLTKVNMDTFNESDVTISKLFNDSVSLDKKSVLKDIDSLVYNITFKAIKYCGQGVSSYTNTFINTKKNSIKVHKFNIKIKDIIDYYGGKDKVPSDIALLIMSKKLNMISILVGEN